MTRAYVWIGARRANGCVARHDASEANARAATKRATDSCRRAKATKVRADETAIDTSASAERTVAP
jgi:hypothetical protein